MLNKLAHFGLLLSISVFICGCRKKEEKRFERISNFEALNVTVKQIVQGENSGVKGLAQFSTEALVGVDISKAHYDESHLIDSNFLTVTLPLPDAHDPRVIESETSEQQWYDLSTGIFTLFPDEKKDQLVIKMKAQAQRNVLAMSNDKEIISLAKEQVEEVFKVFYAKQGISVSIKWEN